MKRVGFLFEEGKAPPRQGAIIQFDGEDVGTVTSGMRGSYCFEVTNALNYIQAAHRQRYDETSAWVTYPLAYRNRARNYA